MTLIKFFRTSQKSLKMTVEVVKLNSTTTPNISYKVVVGGDTMFIRITGYVTETHRKEGFTIKITDDDVKDDKGKHPQVSKEAKITIIPDRYPYQSTYKFIDRETPDTRLQEIEKCMSFSDGLKKGDRVEICVYLVVEKQENQKYVYHIDNNPVNRENYTKFPLWIHPGRNMFRRLEIDTPQTLRFRKQNYYTNKNRKTVEI